MTFKEYCLNYLKERQMFESQINEFFIIFQNSQSMYETMKDRWSEDISKYPEIILKSVVISLKIQVLQYIDKVCPKEWFKPLFEK